MSDFEQLCDAICQKNNLLEIIPLVEKVHASGEINKLDAYGKSPLYLAVEQSDSSIKSKLIKLLIDYGANLELVQDDSKCEDLRKNDTPKKLIDRTDKNLLFLSKIKGMTDLKMRTMEFENQVSDMKSRSITPDTHKSRAMVKDQAELMSFNLSNVKSIGLDIEEHHAQSIESAIVEEQEQKHQEESSLIDTTIQQHSSIGGGPSEYMYYVDEYKYKNSLTSKVLHFGINKKHPSVSEELEPFKVKAPKSISMKSSIKEEKLQELINDTPLTDYEKSMIKAGCQYLEIQSSGKCILIDILDRKNLSTHTVILAKQGDSTILVDPSNPGFSVLLKGFMKDLVVCTDTNKTIYTPKHTTGPQKDQYRDCIDVAVKLAFAINNSDKELLLSEGRIDSSKIGLNHPIESITNCTKVSPLFPAEVEKNVFRIKQSSSITESKKASLLLKIFERANRFFDEEEYNVQTKKTEGPKYNKLNLEYKQNIKCQIQELAKSFVYNKTFCPENYASSISENYSELSNLLNKDSELKLLGEELISEFQYIDMNYGG